MGTMRWVMITAPLALLVGGCACHGIAATSAPSMSLAASLGTAAENEAQLGMPAPDFALRDMQGRTIHLADYRGRTVVLEWFSPACPFVRAAHTKASLKTLGADATRSADVVWFAINSTAPGHPGHGLQATYAAAKQYGMPYPVLLDESGEVGRRYGATNTPYMLVIDKNGALVYRGAIDNSPDGEGESPEGGRLVNYVSDTLDTLAAGKIVHLIETPAYGCPIKY
jgi:peroxiredoxin